MRHLLAMPIAAMLLASGSAGAAGATAIRVSHAWIRVLPGVLPAGGYATLVNVGNVAVALTGAQSPSYRRIMLHESSSGNGMSHMQTTRSVALPAHGKVTLAPGGYHLMLMQPLRKVQPGDLVTVRLQFADGSTQDVQFLARPANAGADF